MQTTLTLNHTDAIVAVLYLTAAVLYLTAAELESINMWHAITCSTLLIYLQLSNYKFLCFRYLYQSSL